jgi:hypothetical protein
VAAAGGGRGVGPIALKIELLEVDHVLDALDLCDLVPPEPQAADLQIVTTSQTDVLPPTHGHAFA